MEQSVNQRTLIFLLVSIGLITLPHVNHIPLPLFGFFSFIFIWRFIGIWKRKILPDNLLIFFLTVSSVVLLYSQHQGILGRDAGTSLFVTALGLKLLEVNKERDIYLVNYLAFIVACSQFLYQQSLFMAGYILLVCCVLLATLVSINSLKPDTVLAMKTAAKIIFQAIPISVVLFVLFPRIEAPRWMFFNQSNTAKSGLTDVLEPGSISNLGLSDKLVFRAKFEGQPPPPIQRYWRGPVFSYTDGKRWTETKKLFFKKYQDTPTYSGFSYQYTLMMEPQKKNWVFALDMPTSYPSSLKQNALYQLINPKNSNAVAEYKLTSNTRYNTGYITKVEFKDNTQLPGKPSQKINQLVEKLQGFDASAEVYIQAVLNHFRQEDFYYSLKPPLMEENPIESFLFDNRIGFCSHYATAFVYLMRVSNIPARIVSGFQGGELNKVGGFLEIREANAHAWAEVWLKNKGWTRVDPTASIAPERIEQDVNIDLQILTGSVSFSAINIDSKTLSWMKKVRQTWNSLDYNWHRWVINYTSNSQSQFLSSMGIKDIKSMIYWLVLITGFITLLLAWFILSTKSSKTDKEVILYQLFCKKLIKAGFNKNKAETAQQFAMRISNQRPDLAKPIENITVLYTRLRYENSFSKNDISILNQKVKQFSCKVTRSK